MRLHKLLLSLLLPLASVAAQAETIRVAIGTQDTTINCAAGGLLVRELNLLENICQKPVNIKTRNTISSGATSPVARR